MNPTDPNNPNSSSPSPFGGTPLPDHNSLTSTPDPMASTSMPAPSTFTPPLAPDLNAFAPSTPPPMPAPDPISSTMPADQTPQAFNPPAPTSDPLSSSMPMTPPAMPADMSVPTIPTPDTFNPTPTPLTSSTDLSSVLTPTEPSGMPTAPSLTPTELTAAPPVDTNSFTPTPQTFASTPMQEPPPSSVPPTSMNNPAMTSLDNPLGVPGQSPTPDGQNTNFSWSNPGTTPPSAPMSPPLAGSPTTTPGLTDLYGATIANPINQPPDPTQPSPILGEPAPTDLSHLINTGSESTVYTPPLTQPETLVSPTNGGAGEVPNVPTENVHKGIPKWVIGVGVALLIVVAATSAYFILGIGKTPEPASIPAADTTTVIPPAVTTPIESLAPVITNPNAGFGNLQGSTPSGTVTSPSPTATSALERLRQQQAAQSPKP